VIAVGGLSPCNQRKSKTSCDNFNGQQNWGACFGDNLSIVAPTPFIGTTLLGGGWCICANGTSSSCPQAAAIAALILTKNINLSADSVRIIIERSAQKVGNYSYNVQKPNGLWNYEMGYGRVDGKRALDMTPAGPNFIYDQSPPVIDLFAPRSMSYSSVVSFTANITDNEIVASGNNAPRLYFYSSQNPVTQFVIGQALANNNYSFTFPQIFNNIWIRYYVAAQDTSSNGNITTYPFGGTGVNPPGPTPPPKFLFFQNTGYNEQMFASSDVPIVISSQRETTIVSTQNISLNKTLLEARCLINIDHSHLSDITVSLISPSGTEIVLTGGVGKDGDNYHNTNFSDYAQFSITDTNFVPPYTGTFRPVEKLWFLNGETSLGLWKLKVVDNVGAEGGILLGWNTVIRFSSSDNPVPVPTRFSLVGNYPNPFNPSTKIYFDVAFTANVKIIIYDITGREVITLLNDSREPKFKDDVDFNAGNISISGGRGLASGIYFYSLVVNDEFIESRKMILLK
jgi:subtilisin-like proprotein convertase family protein